MGKNTAGIKDENQMLMPLSLMTIHKVKSLYAYLKEKTGETEGRSFVMAGLIVLGIVQIYTLWKWVVSANRMAAEEFPIVFSEVTEESGCI